MIKEEKRKVPVRDVEWDESGGGGNGAGVGGFEGLVDEIVEKVYERLLPLFHEIGSKNDCGFLIGTVQISRYVGLPWWPLKSFGRPGSTGRSSAIVRSWYREKGFPLNKDGKGRWWTTKTLVDKWMHEREMMMRKGVELGITKKSARCVNNRAVDIQPEKYTQEQMDLITREIIKDRVKGSLERGVGGVGQEK